MFLDQPLRAAVAAIVIAGVAQAAGAASLSRIGCKGQPNGAKSISPEAISDGGGGQLPPEAIVRIISAQLRITDPVAGGLVVTKSVLNPQEAYGAGLPNGYAGGGAFNPSGPWQGVLWPYRDFADGYVVRPVGGQLGNDIGRIAQLSPTEFIVDGIFGEMAFDPDMPASFMRGIPGNGATDYARYFAVDLLSTVPTEREVMVTLENVHVEVLLRDLATGRTVLQEQAAPDVSLAVHIPAPASGVALLGLLGLRAGRRRRSGPQAAPIT